FMSSSAFKIVVLSYQKRQSWARCLQLFQPVSGLGGSGSLSLAKVAIMPRHSFTALNSVFVVDSEYQFTKELGQGAYGCVVAANHRRTGEGCAIKKITNINTKVKPE